MTNHLHSRPQKTPFPLKKQVALREKAIAEIKKRFLPDTKILKIMLIGSSVKGDFGQYEPPGFRGSLYSDFDFIILVKDDYKIPRWLRREPAGRPFADDKLNLAYRNPRMIEDKFDFEVFFVRERSLTDPEIITAAEAAGIPLAESSLHPYEVVFAS